MNDSPTPDTDVSEYRKEQTATLWRDDGWTARIIKNEDDDGWAVEMLSLIHISEPTRHFKRSRMPSSA